MKLNDSYIVEPGTKIIFKILSHENGLPGVSYSGTMYHPTYKIEMNPRTELLYNLYRDDIITYETANALNETECVPLELIEALYVP